MDTEVEPPLGMALKDVFRAAQAIGKSACQHTWSSVKTPKGQMSMGTLDSLVP